MDSHFLADRLLQAPAGLTLRGCDEGLLVFDENGKTSLLNQQGALVLRALCFETGVTAAQLQGALGMDNESGMVEFQALMASLAQAGLIAA
ncbi:MAG: hypothetical protein ACYC4S_01830 [Rhodoferax sp.]